MKKYLYILPLLALLNSCFKEDDAVSPYPRGDVTSYQIEMGSKYEYQVYFDFSTNSVVKTNHFDEWDLGFQAYDNYYIRMNLGREMTLQDLGPVDFDNVTEGLDKTNNIYDVPSGNLDSTAIGKWWEVEGGKIQSKNHVYVINRGRNRNRRQEGVWKMMIMGADESGFTIKFSELKSNIIDTLFIPRTEGYNFINVSFANGGEVKYLEPPSKNWDILFTSYIEFFDVPGFEIYTVRGALLNERYCLAAEADSLMEFSELTAEVAQMSQFTNIRNVIGYNWKDVDINTGVYTVNSNKKYLIKDTDGFLYKMRFVGFHKVIDGKAQNGYPEFEFKLL